MKIAAIALFVVLFSIASNGQRTTRQPASIAPIAKTTAASPLPIRRVILYSNGVAYIERRGIVTGNAEVNLSFKQSQVDDVLKSMVVLDLGKGQIGAVSYNSSEPASARISEIPFSINPTSGDGGGIASVLSQLQGAHVAVASTKGVSTGSVLTVQQKQVKDGNEVRNTSVLVIASDAGEISSFDLSEVKSVKLLDEGTRRDVSEFANATASARRLDAKTITVTSQGTGQREMVVSYTIAAPIWKTTYRVVLDEKGKPFFQGWAIVDNVSDESWNGVQLTLVSGSPVSFVQQLQNPVYRYRPIIPIPKDLKLAPQVYEPQGRTTSSGVSYEVTAEPNTEINTEPSATAGAMVFKDKDLEALPNDPDELAAALWAMAGNAAGPAGGQIYIDGFEGGNLPPKRRAIVAEDTGVVAAAKGEEIGDLFEYRIEQPVTVERDRSALIPILQTKMDGERVAIYNESVRQDRPFSGVMLKNGTNLTLESGSMTVLDGDSYAGEALMERLKPKEDRLISFALDLGTLVNVRQKAERQPARTVKVVDGTLEVHYFQVEQKTYEVSNQTDKPKVLYIEYPIREGWQLADDSPKPETTTQRFYRFRVALSPAENKQITIKTHQPLIEEYEIASLSRNDLEMFVAKKYIDDDARTKLQQIMDLRQKIADVEQQAGSLKAERQSIEADQKRYRENIESLSKTPEAKTLIERYIAKANDQETRLEEMEKQRKTLEADKERLENDLQKEIKSFAMKDQTLT
jgi:hypothetical protein